MKPPPPRTRHFATITLDLAAKIASYSIDPEKYSGRFKSVIRSAAQRDNKIKADRSEHCPAD
ncbi:hypothetical protein [Mesorhizobium japonicum]|uniref:hypothetical protein n=1 Tax=Mesorhizobium japonicum TaxID=2066070 RepID=UPI00138A5903|nr:hypothetical protein [Mesorhizobium japonicum]